MKDFNKKYCSSGYNRIVVNPDGNINTCFTLNKKISNIWEFDYQKDLNITECNINNCSLCDNNISNISKNKNSILKYKKLNIQLFLTYACNCFCPYCSHSDRTKKYKYEKYQISIDEFYNFLFKIKNKSSVCLLGGEPTIREDFYKLFSKPLIHNIFLFSSSLYYDNIIKAFDEINKNKINIEYIPSLHHTAKNFNWNNFWEVIEYAKNIPTINIPHIHVVNYNLRKIYKKIKEKCDKNNIKILLKTVDMQVVSDRIEHKYVNDLNNAKIRNNFKKLI